MATPRVASAQLTERLQTHFDILAGKGNPGPYNLSWTNIEYAKDIPFEVVVDGQVLRREQYRVDATKGQITFNAPLAEKSVARVSYRYNPRVAVSNPSVTSQPLYLPVKKFGHNTVNVIAVPHSESQKTGSVPLVFSLGGKTRLLGGGLTSNFDFAGGDRSGVQLGFKTGNEKNMVDALFARNAKEFATTTGKAIGKGDAVQQKGLETRLTPAKYLATTYKLADNLNFLNNQRSSAEAYSLRFGEGGAKPTVNFSRNSTLAVTPDKKETRVFANRFDIGTGLNKVTTLGFQRADDTTITPDQKEKRTIADRMKFETKLSAVTGLEFNRAEDTTITPDKKETKVTKDRYDLTTKISRVTSLGFNRSEDTTVAPDDKETRVTVHRYDLATQVNKATTLGFNRAENTTVTPDNKATKNVKDIIDLKTSLGRATTVGLNRTEDLLVTPNDQETRVKTEKLDVAKKLDKMTSVTATTVQSVTDGTSDSVEAIAKGAAFSLTSAANGGAKQATASLNTASKQSKTAIEINRSVTVRLQPAPIFVVAASQTEQKVTPLSATGETGTTSTVLTQTASAEIVPMPGAKVTSAIAETTSNDIKVSTTNFGAEVGTGKPVEIKANVINRSSEATGARSLDTTQTQVALRPTKHLTFTGSYIWNPVDPKNGAILQEYRQEFGVTANMGAVEIGSGYALTTLTGLAKDDVDDPTFGTFSLTLGLKFSRFTRFSGAYRDSLRNESLADLAAARMPKYLRTYNLGLTHDIGEAFNLSLGGAVTDDRSRAKLPTDVKAEAKIGVRF
ncbi:MAG: hypothetical protein SFU56_17060 [Capsulimonadales bacterium]|nr:hypothetical protein [Capsulimonadales bacterium]